MARKIDCSRETVEKRKYVKELIQDLGAVTRSLSADELETVIHELEGIVLEATEAAEDAEDEENAG